MACMPRAALRGISWVNAKLTSAAMRLTRLMGKSRVCIHPKHLVADQGQHRWYLDRIHPGMQVLDVGCGNGVHTISAARRSRPGGAVAGRGLRRDRRRPRPTSSRAKSPIRPMSATGRGALVIGMDYDLQSLRSAQALHSERTAVGLSFVQASAEEALPFADGRFDLVLLLDVLEHLHRRVDLLREVHRVLRDDGTLLLAIPNKDTRRKRRLRAAGLFSYADPDHKIEYSRDEAVAELETGGFRVDGEFMPVVYDTAWAGLIDLVGGVSLGAYRRLICLKRRAAQQHPEESTGWRVVCRRMTSPSDGQDT